MLAKIWRNRNPHALLVGIQSGAAALENSLAVSLKVKLTILPGSSPKVMKTDLQQLLHK